MEAAVTTSRKWMEAEVEERTCGPVFGAVAIEPKLSRTWTEIRTRPPSPHLLLMYVLYGPRIQHGKDVLISLAYDTLSHVTQT